jgi:diguanylate cyclase (GGDEF)-like protein
MPLAVPGRTMAAMESLPTPALPARRGRSLAAVASRAWPRSRLLDARSIVLVVGAALAYALAARLSLTLILQPQNIAPIWPPAGIALGLMLATSRRRWPAIALGVATAVAFANLATGISPGMTLGFVAANTLEPLLAATILRRSGFTGLDTVGNVGRFVAIGGMLAPAASALVGAGAAAVASGAPFVPTYFTWMLSDMGGVLALAPVVMLGVRARTLRMPAGRLAEAVGLAAAIGLMAGLTFLPSPLPIQLAASPLFLIVLVIALRFGTSGATLATAIVAVLATIGTIGGYGPVAHLNELPAVRIGQLQILIAVTFLISMVTAAAMAERRAAETALEVERSNESRRAGIHERIASFAREIARSLDTDAVFQQIVVRAIEVIPAETARLTIMAGEAGAHRIVAAAGAAGEIGRVIAAAEGVTGAVAADGQLRVLAGAEPSAWASATDEPRSDQPLAIACAPVMSDGSVVATLGLARQGTERPFLPDEVSALQVLADIVAVALRNAGEYERAQDLSIRDELTGVPNRRYFTTSFAQLAAQRSRLAPEARVPVSVIMFDLDHFGPVNKERGHATGDVVLFEFGRLLAGRLRLADVVARYGGEEFVAVLVGTGRDDAVRVADEIRAAFEVTRMIGSDGEQIRCTVSAGVATVEAAEASLDALLPTADVALSMAKRAGRNTVSAA